MQRYKLTLEYDGSFFKGWQKQPGLPTVQETLEKALHAFTHEQVEVYGSGRTDRGVHALGQVAHTDFKRDMSEYAIQQALNHYVHLKGISVLSVEKVSPDFHARFSAKNRVYLYKVICRKSPLILHKKRAWQIYNPVDRDSMQEAANCLLGTHDFSTFRSAHCQAKSPLKTLDEFTVTSLKESLILDEDVILFRVSSKSFLHHQVRNMVGTLIMVGQGKWSLEDFKKALAAKDRRQGGIMAPAEGLYLASILY